MQTYGNGSAILSGISVTSPTPEMSVLGAMGGFRTVPEVLRGILLGDRDVDMINNARGEVAQRSVEAIERIMNPVETTPLAPETTPGVELAEGETLLADLTEDGTLVESEDDVAEVIALITDANGTWARIVYAETGNTLDVHADMWEAEFGTDAEMELLGAWDRAAVLAARRTFGLATV